MSENSCNVCHKSGSTSDLKRCAKCKTQWYCSRDCQKADWKNHKKDCARIAGETTGQSAGPSGTSSNRPPKNLSVAIDKPFHRLESRTWLHDRPPQDVYKLLIDCYRLRMEDNYNLEGDCDEDSIYGGQPNGLAGFRRFLRLAERARGVLPPWWNSEKAAECAGLGMRDGWSSLATAVEKHDIIEHYDHPRMPMELRILGEQIYGRGPGGQSGAMMVQLMKGTEGGGMASSTIDMNSLLGRV